MTSMAVIGSLDRNWCPNGLRLLCSTKSPGLRDGYDVSRFGSSRVCMPLWRG